MHGEMIRQLVWNSLSQNIQEKDFKICLDNIILLCKKIENIESSVVKNAVLGISMEDGFRVISNNSPLSVGVTY
jgi:hypothetical protein